MAVEARVQRCGGNQRDDAQGRVLEESKRKDAAGRIPSTGSLAPKRPVVDGEAARAAGRSEHPEPGDHRLRRCREVHLGAVLHTGDVSKREDVAEVGQQLSDQARAEPHPRVLGVDDVTHVPPSDRGRQEIRDDDRRARGGDDHRHWLFLDAKQLIANGATSPEGE